MRRSGIPVVTLAFMVTLALIGCSASTSDREQALGALDRATQAPELESQMASLVADIPSDPSQQQGQKINASVNEIDNQAETLPVSADSGKTYDQQINQAVNETRGADEQGNLTHEDADVLKQTIVAVDQSGGEVARASKEVLAATCTADSYNGGGPVSVEIESGYVACVEAVRVLENYMTPFNEHLGSEITSSIDGWTCGSKILKGYETGSDIVRFCNRPSDGSRIVGRSR